MWLCLQADCLIEHMHSHCYQSSLFLIGQIQYVTTAPGLPYYLRDATSKLNVSILRYALFLSFYFLFMYISLDNFYIYIITNSKPVARTPTIIQCHQSWENESQHVLPRTVKPTIASFQHSWWRTLIGNSIVLTMSSEQYDGEAIPFYPPSDSKVSYTVCDKDVQLQQFSLHVYRHSMCWFSMQLAQQHSGSWCNIQ